MFSSAFIFFVLAFVYLICGILIKKFKMGSEGLTEMVPNYEFWADRWEVKWSLRNFLKFHVKKSIRYSEDKALRLVMTNDGV